MVIIDARQSPHFERTSNLMLLMAFQILYIFLVFSIYISTPEILMRYIKLWAAMALFSAFWVWKQQNMGFTVAENTWMQTRGFMTHILNGGTLIRYFSTH